MKHMAKFETAWREYERTAVSGVCGSCNMVCGVTRRIKLTPGFSQISLEGQKAKCNKGCFKAEQYRAGFMTSEERQPVCSVYRYELTDEAKNPRGHLVGCLLYTSPSPRDQRGSRMPSSA